MVFRFKTASSSHHFAPRWKTSSYWTSLASRLDKKKVHDSRPIIPCLKIMVSDYRPTIPIIRLSNFRLSVTVVRSTAISTFYFFGISPRWKEDPRLLVRFLSSQHYEPLLSTRHVHHSNLNFSTLDSSRSTSPHLRWFTTTFRTVSECEWTNLQQKHIKLVSYILFNQLPDYLRDFKRPSRKSKWPQDLNAR